MTRIARSVGLVAFVASLLFGGLAANAGTASADENCDQPVQASYAPGAVSRGWGAYSRWREREMRERMRREAWRRHAYYPAPAYVPPPAPPVYVPSPYNGYPNNGYPYNGYYR
jgi:hypothetical protein